MTTKKKKNHTKEKEHVGSKRLCKRSGFSAVDSPVKVYVKVFLGSLLLRSMLVWEILEVAYIVGKEKRPSERKWAQGSLFLSLAWLWKRLQHQWTSGLSLNVSRCLMLATTLIFWVQKDRGTCLVFEKEGSNVQPGLKATGATGVIRFMRHSFLVCSKKWAPHWI